MSSKAFYISKLIQKHLRKELSAGENRALQEWINASTQNRIAFQELTDETWVATELDKFGRYDMGEGRRKIDELFPVVRPAVHRVHLLRTSWFRYAAAVILLVGGAAVYWQLSRTSEQSPLPPFTRGIEADVQPGGNRAVLTVGNKTIDLSSNKTGIAVGTAITYTDGEKIADAGKLLQLTTPRGGQYQALLPDGSKIWLNAASSIRFPSTFTGNTREIEVSGEAYLEIAKNSKQPFFVHTHKTTVQVLGTSFNINAYEDEEAERTTLIEGSVRVKSVDALPFDPSASSGQAQLRTGSTQGDKGVILQPGQQAQIKKNNITVTNDQDAAAIAWKNGAFNFSGISLQEAMKQLERWYDLEVVYEKGIPNVHLGGELSRSLSLISLLKALKETDIHYRIENNRKLIILP